MSAIRVLSKVLSAKSMLDLQRKQYSDKIPLSDTCPAAGNVIAKASVSTLGDFLCQYITGSFETLSTILASAVAQPIDDGINHIKIKLVDGNGQRQLFSDYIPADLLLSPGRRKTTTAKNYIASYVGDTVTAPAAAASNQLFFPLEYEYLFGANTDIQLHTQNDSNYAIKFDICFHGIRIVR